MVVTRADPVNAWTWNVVARVRSLGIGNIFNVPADAFQKICATSPVAPFPNRLDLDAGLVFAASLMIFKQCWRTLLIVEGDPLINSPYPWALRVFSSPATYCRHRHWRTDVFNELRPGVMLKVRTDRRTGAWRLADNTLVLVTGLIVWGVVVLVISYHPAATTAGIRGRRPVFL